MGYPDKYKRGYGFANFQESHPQTPLPGVQVDAELDGVASDVGEVVDFLKKALRSDGKLLNGSVGVDALAADLTIGFKAPTNWETGAEYLVDDTVWYSSAFYSCNTAHIAGVSFDAAKWDLIADFGAAVTAAGASATAAAASAATASAAAATATTTALLGKPVISTITALPGSPTNGDRYLVAHSGTSGALVGKEDKVVEYSAGAWLYSAAPLDGAQIYVEDVKRRYKFNSSDGKWKKLNSKLVYLSDFSSLTLAAAMAVASVCPLSIDEDVALDADTTLTCPVRGSGGVITTGSHALTLSGGFSAPSDQKCFLPSDTGVITISNAAEVWVGQYGAIGDSSTDDRAAGQRAIATARASGGGRVKIDRPMLLRRVAGADSFYNGLVIPFNGSGDILDEGNARIELDFVGKGKLLAGDNSMIVLRVSDCCAVMRNLRIDGNGKTSVWGRAFIPENVSQTTTVVSQNFCKTYGGQISNCAEGDVYEGGPTVMGTDSEAARNFHYGMTIKGCTRNIWMRDSTSGGQGGNNRNEYIGGRIGQGSNTGIWIDCGSGNNFELEYEGIDQGSSPSSTPTGVYVKQHDAQSIDNNTNRFKFGTMESVTRPFKNENDTTEIYSVDFDGTACLWTAAPKICMGGATSRVPQILAGLLVQSGSQISGYDNNIVNLVPIGGQAGIKFPATQAPSSDANTLDDYEEGTWTPVLSFGGGSTGMTFSYLTGRYVKVGKKITAWCTAQLSAKGSSTGNGSIAGLPLASVNTSRYVNSAVPAGGGVAAGIVPQVENNYGTSTIDFAKLTTATGVFAVMTHSDFTDTSYFSFSIEYQAAA